jgi:hypothetical protein
MKRVASTLLVALVPLVTPATVHADEATDAVDRSVDAAMKDGRYTFCKKPRTPLFDRQRDLCSLSDLEGCEGFAEACRAPLGESDPTGRSSSPKGSGLASMFAPLAQFLLYLLVAAIVVAIVIPILHALLKARRNRKLADRPEPARAVAEPAAPPPIELEEISDAEAALRMAEDLRRRGEHARALGLYLAAALTALDRRGAIRIAKHRTNGEYVRFCTDEPSKPPLREIVREVDKVQFGKIAPSEEAIARVAQRATSLVRQVSTTALLALAILVAGCSGGRGLSYDDPAGDELPLDILKRHGFDVAPLGRSLASVPTSKDKDAVTADAAKKTPEVLVVDVDRVPLTEDETQAHLMRWVEEGGVLVLFGSPSGWPKDLGARSARATDREIVLEDYDIAHDEDEGDDPDEDVDVQGRKKYVKVRETRGRAAEPRAVEWTDATTIGRLGQDTYVARKLVGRGVVIGVASDDLFTNVGVLPKHNGAILVGILRLAARDARFLHPENAPASAVDPSTAPEGEGQGVRVRHAKREDAVPPPATPFAALLAAGLGKGTWHALAAAILLFLAVGIRHARPRTREVQTRRAFAEHVEATGAFWGRAKALPHALSAYGRFVELRLRERIPRGADPVAFLASRANVDPETAARLYERATKAKDDDEVRGDELETIKQLRAMLVKALEA